MATDAESAKLRDALEDCVAFIRGDISGSEQKRRILKEADCALYGEPNGFDN
jgi:hypothetical protein